MPSECILPVEGDLVGEGENLVVSSPEEHTMVVTLAVEPSIKSARTDRQIISRRVINHNPGVLVFTTPKEGNKILGFITRWK